MRRALRIFPLDVTWSLAVEEQFYLVWPLLVRYLGRRTLMAVLGAVVLAAPIARTIALGTGTVGWMTTHMAMFFRADSFALGGGLALLLREPGFDLRRWRVPARWVAVGLGTALLGLIVAGQFDRPSFLVGSVGYSLLGVTFAALLVASLTAGDGLRRVLTFPAMVRIGAVSYGLYILHPLTLMASDTAFSRAGIHIDRLTGVPLLDATIGTLAVLVCANLVAEASFRWFEHPLLRLKRFFRPRPAAGNRPRVRILSNMPRLGTADTSRYAVEHTLVSPDGSFRALFVLVRRAREYDIVLLNNDPQRLLRLCLLRWLVPLRSWRLVSNDIQLQTPRGRLRWLRAAVVRVLLWKVDLFVHYFTDLRGYARHYGITPARSLYVPFKVNGWETVRQLTAASDGAYVLTAGRSHRDLDTFCAAMRLLDHPGVLLHQSAAVMARHGTALAAERLPRNVQAVEHDGGQESWLAHISGARVVVVPIVPGSISATGISTYLDAMALRKCVVITDSPATRGLLAEEALVVPPADPVALAAAIRTAWEDASLRERVADRGFAYAQRLEGEPRLLRDLADSCGDLVWGDHRGVQRTEPAPIEAVPGRNPTSA